MAERRDLEKYLIALLQSGSTSVYTNQQLELKREAS